MYESTSTGGNITLTPKELKALDSGTRVEILKLLRDRNHTLSEMSKKLSLTPPSVKQHLGILVNTEMIEQLDEGRKWKYYSLTRKGKGIAAGEQTSGNILIVLATSSICLLASFGMLIFNLFTNGVVQFGAVSSQSAGSSLLAAPASDAYERTGAAILPADSLNQEAANVSSEKAAEIAPTVLEHSGNIWDITCVDGIPTLIVLIIVLALIVGYVASEYKRRKALSVLK